MLLFECYGIAVMLPQCYFLFLAVSQWCRGMLLCYQILRFCKVIFIFKFYSVEQICESAPE